MDESELLKSRFEELYERAYMRGYNTFSEFLNLEGQNILASLNLPCKIYGGFKNAQRVVARFGDNDGDFPISCILIKPVASKFADALTHRDFLGAVMNLGIKRELIGDIIIEQNCGYLFCLNSISEFICNNLNRVKHTSVKSTVLSELPDVLQKDPPPQEIIASSLHIDVLVSEVFHLSRNEATNLFAAGKVFVNGKQILNRSVTAKQNDIISVRGCGRFKFIDNLRTTKKSKYVLKIIKF